MKVQLQQMSQLPSVYKRESDERNKPLTPCSLSEHNRCAFKRCHAARNPSCGLPPLTELMHLCAATCWLLRFQADGADQPEHCQHVCSHTLDCDAAVPSAAAVLCHRLWISGHRN